MQDEVVRPFIIGVAGLCASLTLNPLIVSSQILGGTAGGKTTVCNEVVKRLNVPWVALVSMDRFYRPLTPDERARVADYNFDHPDAFDWPLMRQTVEALTTGFDSILTSPYCCTHPYTPAVDQLRFLATAFVLTHVSLRLTQSMALISSFSREF